MIPIYIPTRGRVNRQITWDNFPPEVQKHTTLICPIDELSIHREKGRNAQFCSTEGISNKLQWLQQLAISKGQDKIVCVHDDIWVNKRILNGDSYRILKANSEQVIELFTKIEEKLDIYLSVGIRNRNHAQDLDIPEGEEAQRQVILHGTKPQEIRKLGIVYNDVQLMEDFHATLSLLERGFPNYIINEWCYNETPPGTPGGCAIYRDAEFQRKAALRLHELHPQFVKVVKKPTRWGIGESLDVVVAWKKAYESGLASKRKKLI